MPSVPIPMQLLAQPVLVAGPELATTKAVTSTAAITTETSSPSLSHTAPTQTSFAIDTTVMNEPDYDSIHDPLVVELNKTKHNRNFIHAPSGSKAYEILLKHAYLTWQSETQHEGTKSHIVILSPSGIESKRLATELVRLSPRHRRGEVLRNIRFYSSKEVQDLEVPKIIFADTAALRKIYDDKAKEDDNGEEKKSKLTADKVAQDLSLNTLRYLYVPSLTSCTSTHNYQVFNLFANSINQKNSGSLNTTILGTDNYSRLVLGAENNQKIISTPELVNAKPNLQTTIFIGSPNQLRDKGQIPRIGASKGYQTNIGEPKADGRTQVTVADWFENASTYDAVANELETNFPSKQYPRVVIRMDRIEHIRKLAEKLIAKGKRFAVINSEENYVYNGNEKIGTANISRSNLLEHFGKDFDILLHCSSLDGMEFPAEGLMLCSPLGEEHHLEKILAPVFTADRTLAKQNPRKVWYLKRVDNKELHEELESINDRHYRQVQVPERREREDKPESAAVNISGMDLRIGPGLKPQDFEYAQWTAELEALTNQEQREIFLSNAPDAETKAKRELLLIGQTDGDMDFVQAELATLGLSSENIQKLAAKFPHITGLANSDQVEARAKHILKTHKINDDYLEDFYRTWNAGSPGSNGRQQLKRILAEFIFERYPSFLIDHGDHFAEAFNLLTSRPEGQRRKQDFFLNEDRAKELVREFISYAEPRFSSPNLIRLKTLYSGYDLAIHFKGEPDRAVASLGELIRDPKQTILNLGDSWAQLIVKHPATAIAAIQAINEQNTTEIIDAIKIIFGNSKAIQANPELAQRLLEAFSNNLGQSTEANIPIISKISLNYHFPKIFSQLEAIEARDIARRIAANASLATQDITNLAPRLGISKLRLIELVSPPSIDAYKNFLLDFINLILINTGKQEGALYKRGLKQMLIMQNKGREFEYMQNLLNKVSISDWLDPNDKESYAPRIIQPNSPFGKFVIDYSSKGLACYYRHNQRNDLIQYKVYTLDNHNYPGEGLQTIRFHELSQSLRKCFEAGTPSDRSKNLRLPLPGS